MLGVGEGSTPAGDDLLGGVLLGLHWPVGLLTIATWLVIAAVFRISSLAALIAILLTPLYIWWLIPEPALLAAMVFMGTLLFWRHRSNIENLLQGTEGRIGSKPEKPAE